jgi:hypothetical protein
MTPNEKELITRWLRQELDRVNTCLVRDNYAQTEDRVYIGPKKTGFMNVEVIEPEERAKEENYEVQKTGRVVKMEALYEVLDALESLIATEVAS